MSTFNSPTDVATGALARSANINDLDAACVEAFGLLPTNVQINTGATIVSDDTGVADAYVATMPKSWVSYANGYTLILIPANTNTGASTINVDGQGVKDIKTTGGAALAAGDITVGIPVMMMYSETSGDFHIAATAGSVAAAAASAAAAAASETAAAASAAAASTSETNSASSETAAAASAVAAAASAEAIMVDPVWADLLKDGATPPDAATDLTISNKKWRYRDFDHAQTEDVHFGLIVPPGYGTIKYRVVGAIGNATGPSSEGMAFTLEGYCSGDNDPMSQTYGTPVTVTKTGLTAIQNDFIITGWSGAVTVTDIAEYEMANFKFTRDHDHASDDYAQKFAVIAVILHWDWVS